MFPGSSMSVIVYLYVIMYLGKWVPGIVHKKSGSVNYEVNVHGKLCRRHVDQMFELY